MSIRDKVNAELQRDDIRRAELGDTIPTPDTPFNVDNVMRYENGEMDAFESVAFFQSGIDNGHVWLMQGAYGRTAQALIDAGYCTPQA